MVSASWRVMAYLAWVPAQLLHKSQNLRAELPYSASLYVRQPHTLAIAGSRHAIKNARNPHLAFPVKGSCRSSPSLQASLAARMEKQN